MTTHPFKLGTGKKLACCLCRWYNGNLHYDPPFFDSEWDDLFNKYQPVVTSLPSSSFTSNTALSGGAILVRGPVCVAEQCAAVCPRVMSSQFEFQTVVCLQASDGELWVSAHCSDIKAFDPANVTFFNNSALSGGAITSHRNRMFQVSWTAFTENTAVADPALGASLLTSSSSVSAESFSEVYGCSLGTGGAICYMGTE